jgi:eukaryotic-like serine/threonine-protein kinase
MIGTTVSHYKISEKLGGGGMGVVYKAHDLKLDRDVALKFLPPDLTRDAEAKQRFIHEAKAASSLQHNNICTLHDIDETDDGQLFIVMDLYEGETLKKRIENGPLKVNEATDIAIQIAQGLEEAHKHQIVHRDIKPANMLITATGVVKIVDFGLAKLSGRTLLTKSGTTLGTAAYMSPEQAKGEQVDQRTDIWSLGVVLYEMLTGKRPFESEYEQALMYSILNEDPKPMDRGEIPEAIEKICRRAMAKDLKERYQTSDELIADLESYKSGTQLSLKTRKAIGKKRKLVYAEVAAAVLIVAIVGIFLSTDKSDVSKRIAVLPFESLSKDSLTVLLELNMPDEVIARLEQVATLNVPSIKTTMKFKGSEASYAAIARELGAEALVSGKIQSIGNQIRVIMRLIDPETDRSRWTETFDGKIQDIFDLQSKIAQAVLREVRVKVSQGEQERLGRARKKIDPRAYELYLRSRQQIIQLDMNPSKSSWEGSIAGLQRAIDIEPDNALYYAELALYQTDGVGWSFVSSAEMRPKMSMASEKALSLDPDLVESQIAAATVDVWQYNFKDALLRSARALELSPGNLSAHMCRGQVLMALGRLDEALSLFARAQQIDPEQYNRRGGRTSQTLCYIFMRRYDEAIELCKELVRQNPRSDLGHTFLAFALSLKGLHAEALAHNDSAQYWGPSNRPILLLMAGKRAPAMTAYEESLPYQSQNAYGKAMFFALLGQKDSAFKWLEEFYREPSGELPWIRNDPWLDSLRGDPRFKQLLKKMNLLD